jgi:hypothetical protein
MVVIVGGERRDGSRWAFRVGAALDRGPDGRLGPEQGADDADDDGPLGLGLCGGLFQPGQPSRRIDPRHAVGVDDPLIDAGGGAQRLEAQHRPAPEMKPQPAARAEGEERERPAGSTVAGLGTDTGGEMNIETRLTALERRCALLETVIERWLISDGIDAAISGRTSAALAIEDLLSMDLALDARAGDEARRSVLSDAAAFVRECEPPAHARPPRKSPDGA